MESSLLELRGRNRVMLMIGVVYGMDWKAKVAAMEYSLGLVNPNPNCSVFFQFALRVYFPSYPSFCSKPQEIS